MKSILKLAAAVAIVGSASTALAQSGNGSDVSGPVVSSLAGGSFVPLPHGGGGGGGAGASGAASASISSTGAAFARGAPETSPATGQPIPQAAVQAVGSLITGGSPASVAQVGAALTAGGAPAGAVSNLTQALANLSSASGAAAPAAIIAAARAYNTLVANAPASFLRNPPADFQAIQAALTQMVHSIGH